MKHIQKWFWVYSIILILLGLYIDSLSNEAEIVGQQVVTTLVNGDKVPQLFYKYQPTKLIPKILSGILYSTAISLLLLFLIDKRIDSQENAKTREESNRIREELHKNIFTGVLRKVIPEEIFDKFNKEIFNTNLIRKNAKWTYEITTKDNKHGSYNVKQSITYELHNMTDSLLEDKLPINITANSSICETKLSSIVVCDKNKNEDKSFNLTDKIVKIPQGEYITIKMVVDNEYKQSSVLDVHNSMFSIIGLEIMTIQPEDISVKIIPSFSGNLTVHDSGSTWTKYENIDTILKGQGIAYVIERLPNNSIIGENKIMLE